MHTLNFKSVKLIENIHSFIAIMFEYQIFK